MNRNVFTRFIRAVSALEDSHIHILCHGNLVSSLLIGREIWGVMKELNTEPVMNFIQT
jgi:hypothetical protein